MCHPVVRAEGVLTKLRSSFLSIDDGSFGGQVGAGAPRREGPLAGVELLSEKLLQLHADLDEVWCGGAWNDHLENVPVQVPVDKDLTVRREEVKNKKGLRKIVENKPTSQKTVIILAFIPDINPPLHFKCLILLQNTWGFKQTSVISLLCVFSHI